MGPTSESQQFTRSSKRLQKQREEAAGPSQVTRTSSQQPKQREEAAGPSKVPRTSRQQQKQRQEAEPQGVVPVAPVAPVATTSIASRTLTLTCWILERSCDAFLVEVEDSKQVGHLKRAIKVSAALEGIGEDRLVLWKVSIPDKDLTDEGIQRRLPQNKLSTAFQLLMHFPYPEPAAECVNIVAAIWDYVPTKKRKRDDEGGPPPEVERLRKAFSKAAPSSLANPAVFKTISGPDHTVACNCPFEFTTIPLVLLHEAFGIFKDRCGVAPSRQALLCLSELACAACDRYDLEVQRRSKIREVLEMRMGVLLVEQKIPGTEFVTDGNLTTIIMPAAIRECKNEQGYVFSQVIAYYGAFLTQGPWNPRRFNYNTRFPSVLIVDMGSLLGFYGAVWDGHRVRVEPLTPVFDLSVHWRDTSARHNIASALDALVAAINNIEAHYKSIEAAASANPAPMEYDLHLQKARGFPFLSSYDDDGRRIAFTYHERIDDNKLIFSATLNQDENDKCLVKFTGQYPEAAHNYMASRGLAPKLRRCVQISAEWTAVIMDRSPYKVLHGLMLPPGAQEKVRRKVSDAVRLLHEGQFVHGDIRDVNILIDLESLVPEVPEAAIHLVDFDWAGNIGMAVYPIDVNKSSMTRPADVEGGGLITEEHDLEMITYLFT